MVYYKSQSRAGRRDPLNRELEMLSSEYWTETATQEEIPTAELQAMNERLRGEMEGREVRMQEMELGMQEMRLGVQEKELRMETLIEEVRRLNELLQQIKEQIQETNQQVNQMKQQMNLMNHENRAQMLQIQTNEATIQKRLLRDVFADMDLP